MQQWPSLGELIMHLVRRVEDDLEAEIAYKDKRMELLTKKIQVLERQSPESPPPEIVRLQQKGFKYCIDGSLQCTHWTGRRAITK